MTVRSQPDGLGGGIHVAAVSFLPPVDDTVRLAVAHRLQRRRHLTRPALSFSTHARAAADELAHEAKEEEKPHPRMPGDDDWQAADSQENAQRAIG